MSIKDLGKSFDPSDIIALRNLDYVEQSKQPCLVEVAIGRPKQISDSRDYYVPYRIKGGNIEKLGYAVGVDAIQALQLVLRAIGADLYVINKNLPGQISWIEGEKGDYGFPLK